MQAPFTSESNSHHINLTGDIDHVDASEARPPDSAPGGRPSRSAFQQYTNPRVQFLRLSSLASTRRGVQGLTPPYQPAAPSLLRPVDIGPVDEHGGLFDFFRRTSPLRNLALSNYSLSVNPRFE